MIRNPEIVGSNPTPSNWIFMKGKIMISLKHLGKCSVCQQEKKVVTFGNTKTRKVADICEGCSKKLDMKTSKFVEKYGKKDEEPFKPGIRILPGNKKTCT